MSLNHSSTSSMHRIPLPKVVFTLQQCILFFIIWFSSTFHEPFPDLPGEIFFLNLPGICTLMNQSGSLQFPLSFIRAVVNQIVHVKMRVTTFAHLLRHNSPLTVPSVASVRTPFSIVFRSLPRLSVPFSSSTEHGFHDGLIFLSCHQSGWDPSTTIFPCQYL